MIYYWRVKTRLPKRFGQRCRVLARNRIIWKKSAQDQGWFQRTGKKFFSTNSCLVEFEDGFRVVTSRNYVRRNHAQ